MNELTLFGSYTSPFVRHCRIVLEETGTSYRFVETDYAASDEGSPTKRVPYLHDGEIKLYDSSAIIQYIRQKSGQSFLATVTETEQFALANTVLDTAINLFLLENNGIANADNPFLQRQQARINSGLLALGKVMPPQPQLSAMNDAHWRVACLLDWGLFRQRLSVDNTPNLQAFLTTVQTWDVFKASKP